MVPTSISLDDLNAKKGNRIEECICVFLRVGFVCHPTKRILYIPINETNQPLDDFLYPLKIQALKHKIIRIIIISMLYGGREETLGVMDMFMTLMVVAYTYSQTHRVQYAQLFTYQSYLNKAVF